MNYKTFYKVFLERYSGSKQLRKIWYHGTSSIFLNSIFKNGLKVDTKQKSWDSDKDASYEIVDRTSYGGIYLTTNLATANSAAYRTCNKFGGKNIIVISELQTKTLVSDEDDFLSFHSYRDMSGAGYFYLGITRGFDDSQEKKEYFQFRNKWIKEKLNNIILRYPDINKILLSKISKLLRNIGWFRMIQRAAAYIPEHSFNMVNKEDYPSKEKAEKEYREFIDKLTKLMRLYPRQTHGRETARSLKDITFRGSNRIVCIVELVSRSQEENYRTDVILLYGKIPDKFEQDFKNLYNPTMNVIDNTRKRL